MKFWRESQQEEKEFTEWVEKDPARKAKYGTVLKDIEEAVVAGEETKKAYTKAFESIYRIEITTGYYT